LAADHEHPRIGAAEALSAGLRYAKQWIRRSCPAAFFVNREDKLFDKALVGVQKLVE
jgi:hypothetical protein